MGQQPLIFRPGNGAWQVAWPMTDLATQGFRRRVRAVSTNGTAPLRVEQNGLSGELRANQVAAKVPGFAPTERLRGEFASPQVDPQQEGPLRAVGGPFGDGGGQAGERAVEETVVVRRPRGRVGHRQDLRQTLLEAAASPLRLVQKEVPVVVGDEPKRDRRDQQAATKRR